MKYVCRALPFALPALVALACGDPAQTDGGDPVTGDGDGTNEVVSERQLMGNELPEGSISLTFDDGPGDRTAELAEFLAASGVPSTFFINGKNAPGRQRHLDAIVNRGHLLANHTQNHVQLTKLTGGALLKEVTDTDRVIAAAQPNGPWLLRAPFGAWNGRVAGEINGTPMTKYVGSIFWDEGGELTARSAADWACWGQRVTVERCADLYFQEIEAKKRGIVLMHDVHGKTVDMVKILVPRLAATGRYKFVQVTEAPAVKRALVAAGGPPPGPETCFSATLGKSVDENVCVQSRRDQNWYRCVDREWHAASGPADAACTAKHPLQ
jgi:peptidoglycan/xylan/chitin deacetylase (PgdA/CDA1 family)